MTKAAYDIVILSDFRFTGGNSSALIEDVRAQHAAGYSTALIHVPAHVIKTDREFHPDILDIVKTGQADLLPLDQPVRARLLQIRHPSVFQRLPVKRPQVEADVKILVVNSSPFDRDRTTLYYNVNSVRTSLETVFGEGVVWAPVSPFIREALLKTGWRLNLSREDWYDILDPDEWKCDRSRFVADRPVIGRHSRDGLEKWPATAEEILAAYPDDERFVVRILGGASTPESLLGRKPPNWEVHEFGAIPARQFLCRIDFFVYFHHPMLIDALPHTILEALSSGAVAILPPSFEKLFRDAAIIAQPNAVRNIVLRLYRDKAAYQAQSERGYNYALQHFSPQTHVARLSKLIGPPTVQKGSGL